MNAGTQLIKEKLITDKFLLECNFRGIFLLSRIKKYSLNFKFLFVVL